METLILLLFLVHATHGVSGQQYFRVKPHDTSVVAGGTAELHCHIGNRAGLVQWSKDGFLLGYDPEIPGYERYEMRVDHSKSAYTLLVHEARLDDEAEFQCQVGPGKNEKPIRSVARLTVLVPPKLLSINDLPNGSEIQVREAEKIVLVCQALSSKPATILKWYRKSIELMPEASRTTVRREGEKLYSTLSSITLYPKGDTSEATYTCEALHPALEKTLKTTVSVGVLYPPGDPVIDGFRDGDVVEAGDSLTLVCSSNGGKPPATLVWYRNGEQREGAFTTVGRESINTMSFKVHSSDNNVVYSCEASNPLTENPLRKTVKLSVLYPPSRVNIDGPAEVNRGETVTLTCRSDASNPPAVLTWMVEEDMVDSRQSASHPVDNGWYTVSNLTATITRQDKDVKTITCIAHGAPRHEKVYQSFNISILYPPEAPIISGYDENSDLREGDLHSFTCSALAGNPSAELRWYRGMTEVSSAANVMSGHVTSILTFRVEASDNGIAIRCDVNNTVLPEPLSGELKLTVLFAPSNVTIAVEPPHPREGDTVNLECWSGSSNPAADILWWKNDDLLKGHNQHVESFNGAFYTRSRINVPVTSSDDGSRFTCEAKNSACEKSVSEQLILRVLYAPIFPSSGKVIELVEGRSAEVNLSARANPEAHSYSWTREGVEIPNRNYELARVSASGSILYFNQVSRHDSGAYTCIAKNSEGSSSATLTLNVLYPATVSNISGITEMAEGETVLLGCTADGNPLTEDTLSWRRKSDPVRNLVTGSPEPGHSILSIVNVTRNDSGGVECVADNGVGPPSIGVVQLVILYRPSIVKHLVKRRIAGEERMAVELNCVADGYPDVIFAWSFNGSTIGPSDASKYSVYQSQKSNHEWWSALLIKALTREDYGVYTCIAGNQLGHDFVTISIVKRSAPDTPESLEAVNVSHQAALLSWNPGFDGGLVQSFQLRVRKDQVSSLTVVHVPINSTTHLLSGLEPGTLYRVSIAAKNSLGESAYTNPITFRTKRLPVMDSTVSGPVSSGSSSVEFLPAWLLVAAVIGSLVVVANILFCVIYIRRKRTRQAGRGPPDIDAKKIPSEEHSPFYLTGTSVDDAIDAEAFQKSSRDTSDDGHSSGRRCDCRQWSSTLICGGRIPGEENQHEQCPDILKRDSCHCHASGAAGQRLSETEVEVSSLLGAVMYGQKEPSSGAQEYPPREPPSPAKITLTTFQAELPIRHNLIGPKLETVINGHDEDS